MKKLLVAFVAVSFLALTGCAMSFGPGAPAPMGVLFKSASYPNSYNYFNAYNGSYGQGGAPLTIVGSVKGEACASSILALIGTGDNSISKALENAGGVGKKLTNVKVDVNEMSILGFVYSNACTVVSADVVQ